MADAAAHVRAVPLTRRNGRTISAWFRLSVVVDRRVGSIRQFVSGEFTMSIFSYRKHLRFLTHSQRRRWWDQRKRLTPRVQIGGAYVPPSVTREFTYVKVG
jgi:hypothetical protein